MFTFGFEKIAISRAAAIRAINNKHRKLVNEAAEIRRKMRATKDTRMLKKYNDMMVDGSSRFNKFDKRRISITNRLMKNKSDKGDPMKNWYKSSKTKWKERGVAGAAGLGLLGLLGASGYTLDVLRKKLKSKEKRG